MQMSSGQHKLGLSEEEKEDHSGCSNVHHKERDVIWLERSSGLGQMGSCR